MRLLIEAELAHLLLERSDPLFDRFDPAGEPFEFPGGGPRDFACRAILPRCAVLARRFGGGPHRAGHLEPRHTVCGERPSGPQPVGVASHVLDNASDAVQYQDRIHDVVQEGPVVGDQQHGAGILEEQLFEEFQTVDIQIVRRLVEHQQIGRQRKEPCE